MAKKKNVQKKSVAQSPKQFLKEKANKLPIYKCMITPGWEGAGECFISISRQRGNGNLCVANFLVDCWCLGVKEVYGNVNMDPDTFKDFRERAGLVDIDYPTVHNIIYGAIEFAEEAGIEPCRDFNIWEGVLSEDNDDVPLIEMEFGKDGKHLLVTEPGTPESRLIPRLREKLGDNFDYILNGIDDFSGLFNSNPIDHEEYHYVYPEYPSELKLNHRMIADILYSKENYERIPDKVADDIYALPLDEMVEDLSNIIIYEIGRTYRQINDGTIGDPENSPIMHSLVLLSEIDGKKAMPGLMELLHQDEKFFEYHLGDAFGEFLIPALTACAYDSLKDLEAFLNESGLNYMSRVSVSTALSDIANEYPENRDKVIEIYRRQLADMPARLPERDRCDAETAAFMICDCMNMHAAELLPEIKAVMDTNLVEEDICGDYDSVEQDLRMPTL